LTPKGEREVNSKQHILLTPKGEREVNSKQHIPLTPQGGEGSKFKTTHPFDPQGGEGRNLQWSALGGQHPLLLGAERLMNAAPKLRILLPY
jgi:hypothetical protein